MQLINMSGHPLSEQAVGMAESEGLQVRDIPVPNIDMGDGDAMVEFVRTSIKPLASEKTIQTGDFEIILPGMSPIAALTLSALHGSCGHFPRIRWIIKNEDGVYILSPSSLDIQKLREAFRGFRTA